MPARGRGRNVGTTHTLEDARMVRFYVKTIKQKPNFIYARPAAVLGIICHTLGRAQDPPLRCAQKKRQRIRLPTIRGRGIFSRGRCAFFCRRVGIRTGWLGDGALMGGLRVGFTALRGCFQRSAFGVLGKFLLRARAGTRPAPTMLFFETTIYQSRRSFLNLHPPP